MMTFRVDLISSMDYHVISSVSLEIDEIEDVPLDTFTEWHTPLSRTGPPVIVRIRRVL